MSFNFADYKRIDIPEGRVKQIARASDGLVLWTAGYINQIPLSIDTDGSIYNGTGYKRGYRISSSGAEAAMDYTSCSGFIPVSPGDVVRITNCNFSYASISNAINAANSSFTSIGRWTMSLTQYGIFDGSYSAYSYGSVVVEKTGVWKWVVPPAASGVAYIRLSCYDTVSGGPYEMVLTINEEIT